MFRNNLKIAWRNLVKGKMYTVINVMGLAVGMTVAMLIAFWIWDEVTYDRSFSNHQQLAQVMTNNTGDDGTLSTMPNVCRPIAGELRTKYGSDFKNVAMATWNWGHVLTVGDKIISSHGPWVEENFPTMFSLNMLKGNINALGDPSSIIINASMAKTLFGSAEPIGKVIRLDNKDNYTVAGIFKDFPDNSTLNDAKYFLPWKKYVTMDQWVKDAATDWYNRSWLCYAQLADNIDIEKETAKIKNVVMGAVVAVGMLVGVAQATGRFRLTHRRPDHATGSREGQQRRRGRSRGDPDHGGREAGLNASPANAPLQTQSTAQTCRSNSCATESKSSPTRSAMT